MAALCRLIAHHVAARYRHYTRGRICLIGARSGVEIISSRLLRLKFTQAEAAAFREQIAARIVREKSYYLAGATKPKCEVTSAFTIVVVVYIANVPQ